MKRIVSLSILLLTINLFSQSPWTKEKGKLYTQLSFTTIPSYGTLFGNPDYSINGKITDNTIQFYGEYGLSDKTTLLINLPFKSISYKENLICISAPCETQNHSEFSLGNIEIGLKTNFLKKEWIISGQLNLEANTGTFNAASGIRTGYDSFTFTPLFLAGKSFGKNYFQTFLGANIRTNKYSSNFKIGGEYGRKISNKIWLIGFLDIVKSFKNGNVSLANSNTATGLYVNDQEYGGFGLKGIYEFNTNFGINTGFGGAFFGNNVAKQAAFTFGVYRKF